MYPSISNSDRGMEVNQDEAASASQPFLQPRHSPQLPEQQFDAAPQPIPTQYAPHQPAQPTRQFNNAEFNSVAARRRLRCRRLVGACFAVAMLFALSIFWISFAPHRHHRHAHHHHHPHPAQAMQLRVESVSKMRGDAPRSNIVFDQANRPIFLIRVPAELAEEQSHAAGSSAALDLVHCQNTDCTMFGQQFVASDTHDPESTLQPDPVELQSKANTVAFNIGASIFRYDSVTRVLAEPLDATSINGNVVTRAHRHTSADAIDQTLKVHLLASGDLLLVQFDKSTIIVQRLQTSDHTQSTNATLPTVVQSEFQLGVPIISIDSHLTRDEAQLIFIAVSRTQIEGGFGVISIHSAPVKSIGHSNKLFGVADVLQHHNALQAYAGSESVLSIGDVAIDSASNPVVVILAGNRQHSSLLLMRCSSGADEPVCTQFVITTVFRVPSRIDDSPLADRERIPHLVSASLLLDSLGERPIIAMQQVIHRDWRLEFSTPESDRVRNTILHCRTLYCSEGEDKIQRSLLSSSVGEGHHHHHHQHAEPILPPHPSEEIFGEQVSPIAQTANGQLLIVTQSPGAKSPSLPAHQTIKSNAALVNFSLHTKLP